MKTIISILLTFLLLPLAGHAATGQEISPLQVHALMSEGSGLWLIDVRGPQAFEEAHIEGAVNIPPNSLAVKRFPVNKVLVVVDNSLGQLQAKESADALVRNGQKRVYVLTGGVAAWEQAKLPMVGDGLNWSLRQVMPQELAEAQQQKVKVSLFDLRDENDYIAVPLEASTIVPGKGIDERLQKLVKQLEQQQQKNLAAELKQQPVTVVVLPAAVDARQVYQQHLWRLPGDIRVLDGAYLVVRRGERQTISSGDGCRTCPGG